MLTYSVFGEMSNIFLGVFLLWTAVWKGIGMWKSARNNQRNWFIAMLVLNTMGILPIIYLTWFQKKRK